MAKQNRFVLCTLAFISLFAAASVHAQSESKSTPDKGDHASEPRPDYSHGVSAFPGVLNPYKPDPIHPLELQNSPRLHDLIHEHHLRLSLSDALALALEKQLRQRRSSTTTIASASSWRR